jgi:hypothetical protein
LLLGAFVFLLFVVEGGNGGVGLDCSSLLADVAAGAEAGAGATFKRERPPLAK